MSQEHEGKKSNSIFAIGINMTLACIISGIIIAVVYTFTAPIANEQKIKTENASRQEIIKEADEFRKVEGKEGWYMAFDKGKFRGYIVPTESKGYGGAIKMLVGVSEDVKIIGYKILSMNETPGLGDNAAKPKFSDQFTGKSEDALEVVKVPTKEKIEAITGATITSKAVTKGIKQALEEVRDYLVKQKVNR